MGEFVVAVRSVNLIKHHVSDWPAAIAFYRDALGLKLTYEQENVWASFEAPDGGRIGLVLEREGVRHAPHVMVKVDGLGALVEKLRDAGVEVLAEPTVAQYGAFAVVRDPAGNLIELVE